MAPIIREGCLRLHWAGWPLPHRFQENTEDRIREGCQVVTLRVTCVCVWWGWITGSLFLPDPVLNSWL